MVDVACFVFNSDFLDKVAAVGIDKILAQILESCLENQRFIM